MNYIQTEIEGVWIIEPKVFNDARGYFMKHLKKENFVPTSVMCILCRTTNRNRLSAYCADCITKKANIARLN